MKFKKVYKELNNYLELLENNKIDFKKFYKFIIKIKDNLSCLNSFIIYDLNNLCEAIMKKDLYRINEILNNILKYSFWNYEN